MLDSRLTIQQIKTLEQLAEQAKAHGVEIGAGDFCLRFDEDARPGRGGGLPVQLAYVDGDHAASAHVDIYGYGTGLFVASLSVECNPAGEEPCEDCEAEEARSDTEPDAHLAELVKNWPPGGPW
ncbi:hypothetical protein [Rhodococcoides fascians]|uniref:hypothetical protein n=1 Tax=Rhodococcoides fascians TaxID=1828 RepID=UPI00050CB86A|nr:hypothetical protein [Rhodococcus fascians]